MVIGCDDPMWGVGAEFEYIQQKHGPRDVAWKRDMQIKIRKEGRQYDVISIVLTDGTRKVSWFEIPSFVGNWR